MKQRFSSLDVKVISRELASALLTLRVANIYDLSSRIFLFKFAKPDQRQSLVVDTGFRCHLTRFSRATANTPSAFVARLRKFLRTRRVTAISQVGTDRIIEIQFSDGQYRLFLEFYASGNLILTDREYSILGVFRVVNDGPEHERARVGFKYCLDNRQNYERVPSVTRERVKAGLQASLDEHDGASSGQPKRSKKKAEGVLRRALAISLKEFPPILIEHALSVAAFDLTSSIAHILQEDALLTQLVVALDEARKTIDNIPSSSPCPGYIIATSRDINDQSNGKANLLYEDFHPFLPDQVRKNPHLTVLEIKNFNETVDEFFCSVESQTLESRLTEREENARKKLAMAKQDHENRLGGLKNVQELNVRKAQAIEANLERVQEAITAVNSLVAKGIDWTEIARLIEMEQKRHNVVAETIKLPLKLNENTVTLLLSEEADDKDADTGGDETGSDVSDSDVEYGKSAKPEIHAVDNRLAIDVELALSPWSNARQYYEQKKFAAVKEQKTLRSSEKALKNTQKKISADLQRGLKQEKVVMRPQRNVIWFEKFIFFISSEGYLCLGGKDAQQAEILYNRYLDKGDVYVHADLQSATAVVVKNRPGTVGDPIPPSTLSQAGTLAVSTSSAWDSKAIFPAWWVTAEQVSKIDSSGQYLQIGDFQVNGVKNFLPPAQLLLGFGVVFRISEESKARHLRHRIQESDARETDKAREPLLTKAPEGKEAKSEENESEMKGMTNQHIKDGSETLPIVTDEVTDFENKHDDEPVSSMESDAETDNPLQPDRRLEHSSSSRIESSSSDPFGEAAHHEFGTRSSKKRQEGMETDAIIDSEDTQRIHTPSPKDPTITETSYDLNNSDNPGRVPRDFPGHLALKRSKQAPISSQIIPGHLQSSQTRGKHGKNHKMKTKYAEQDDEDRVLAMHLLGSDVAQNKAKEEEAAKIKKEQESSLQRERRRIQDAIATERGQETERLRRSNFEEGIRILGDEESEVLKDLDAFIGTPDVADEILDAFVMCGPWAAISRCSWKAKLQPGTVKKGKAVREILQVWTRMISDREEKERPGAGEGSDMMKEEARVRRREGDLIRSFRETEVVGVVPVGKVRISMGADAEGARGRGGSGAAGKGRRGGNRSKRPRERADRRRE